MRNYLWAECYKMLRRKYFYLSLLVCLALEGLMLWGSYLSYSWGNESINFPFNAAMVTSLLAVGLYACVITGDIVFSDQYKNNTLKNEVAYGLPRARIYLGKLLVAGLASLIAAVLMLGFYLGMCWILFPHTQADGTAWALIGYCLAGALPLWLAGQALVNLFYFLIRSNTLAAFAVIGIFGVLAPVLQGFSLLLNPVFGTLRQYLPNVMLESLRSMAFQWDYLALCWVVGLIWGVGATVLGLVLFQKKEIN